MAIPRGWLEALRGRRIPPAHVSASPDRGATMTVQEEFPKGCRVSSTPDCPGRGERAGTVRGWNRAGNRYDSDCVRVLWDGQKTIMSYHRSFLIRVVPPRSSLERVDWPGVIREIERREKNAL